MTLRTCSARPLLKVVTLVTALGSVALNCWFWAGRSSGLVEAVIAGVLGGGLDVVKIIAAGLLVSVVGRGQGLAIAVVTGLLVLGIVASGVASIGFYFANRDATVGVAGAKGELFKGQMTRLNQLQIERGRYKGGSIAEVEARIALLLARVPARLRSGTGCVAAAAMSECGQVRELQVEVEEARQAEALDREIGALQAQLTTRVGDAAHQHGDAQARMLARMTGVAIEKVELVLGVLFAVLVEAVTAGAPFLMSVSAARTEDVAERQRAPARQAEPVQPARAACGAFAAKVLTLNQRGHVRRPVVMAALQGFCAARSEATPTWEELAATLREQGIATAVLNGEAGLIGIEMKRSV